VEPSLLYRRRVLARRAPLECLKLKKNKKIFQKLAKNP
jgi:hypothetical protein